jgi:small subunit ribosomal protein S6
MRTYELIVLLHPDLEIDADAAIAKIEKLITSANGKVTKRDNWGKRRLAYKIKKHDFAVYVFFVMQLEPADVVGLENSLRITEEVIRHLLVSEINTKNPKDSKETKAVAASKEA